jgi:PAS domain S-box-containing protein
VEFPVIVHTAPIRNSDGELELVIEISADSSEVTRLQEELRTSRQRYQQLFDEVPCYITVQDSSYRITAANRRFKEDFGEKDGAPCYEAYKNQESPCEDCPIAKTFEDGKSHQKEMVVTTSSGRQYNVLVWTAPIRNALGEITQVMEMATNITQVRKLQDHLSSLGLMIGSISHGIKGVLTGLDAGIYLLDSGFSKRDKQKSEEGLELVKMMADRIRRVVMDILYYAKKRTLNWKQTDVKSLVNETLLLIRPKLDKHGIMLEESVDQNAGMLEADEVALRSALVNILENAVEACSGDTSGRQHQIDLTLSGEDEYITLRIRDNGVGMDEETVENIFELFYSSKGSMGTGLGLFITKRIIEQHAGTIEVISESGKGSGFSIRLPRSLPLSVKNGYEDLEPSSLFSSHDRKTT